ncbi:MAG: type IX secretion system outer membrane channel protein PorV [Mariniphaga sp.]
MRLNTVLIFLLVLFSLNFFASALAVSQEVRYNPIYTAVPFLTITPDSRHGAMGDVGAATSPDANSQYMNPSKFAFARDKWGFALSFTPWLRQLVSDVNLAYLSGFYQLDPTQAIGTSLRYFSMGAINLLGVDKTHLGTISPGEFALDFSYSRRLSDYFSGGVSLRFIRSDLGGGVGGTQVGAETYSAGNAFATDVSFYYHHLLGGEFSKKTLAAGVNFSNIGSKISYNQGSTKEFLPANLRLGTTYTVDLGDSSSIAISLDLNKLLVPTPLYRVDNSGNVIRDNNLSQSVISSIFGSFSDAPGGLKEELQEVTVSLGAEYWYKRQFAVRGGYFNESQYKGNRKYFTAGVGVKLNVASIDISYLIPVLHNNPLSNTIRFTLLFNIDSFLKRKKANTVNM